MFCSYYEWSARQRQKELVRAPQRREWIRLSGIKLPRLRWRSAR